MNAILFVFFSLLVGDEKIVVDNPVQPVVVAKNDLTPASAKKPLPVPNLFRYDWTDETFEICDEWSQNFWMIDPATIGYGIKYKIQLDPPTECEVRFLVADPNNTGGRGKWTAPLILKSGDLLDESIKNNHSGPNNCDISFKGSVGQKVIVSMIAPITFNIGKKELKKKLDFPRNSGVHVFSSGSHEGTSELVEIPAGYEFEGHLEGNRPLVVDYLKDRKIDGVTELSPLACFGNAKVSGIANERTMVVFRCHDDNSKLVITLKPIKGFRPKIQSTAPPVAKKE